jgi:hypothetical protein
MGMMTPAKVEKGTLTAAVTVKGVVEAGSAAEVSVKPKAWAGPLQVKKAVDHGAPVKAGDVLVEFDADKLDQALKDARQERDLADLAIRMAELELPILEKQLPLDLAAAEREQKNAADDLKRFVEVDKPLAIQTAEQQLKQSNFSLEYARDELKQLTKMYKDKDLTEETEEMILKRHKHQVESAEFFARRAKIATETTMTVTLPRQEQAAKDKAMMTEIALAKARDIQPLAVNQKRLTLAKLRYEQAKAREKLSDLEKDRAALTAKAPADGLAYHGRAVRGQWSTGGGPGGGLQPGGAVMPGEVFVTVVSADKLSVRAEVDEKDLAGLKKGQAAKVTATAFPDKKLSGTVAKVAAAPLGGKFEVRVELDGDADGVVPGMTGTVRVVTATKKDALSVPAAAVFTDDDGETRYVYRTGKGQQKHPVKVGMTAGDRVEIVEGLEEGDVILPTKP